MNGKNSQILAWKKLLSLPTYHPGIIMITPGITRVSPLYPGKSWKIERKKSLAWSEKNGKPGVCKLGRSLPDVFSPLCTQFNASLYQRKERKPVLLPRNVGRGGLKVYRPHTIIIRNLPSGAVSMALVTRQTVGEPSHGSVQ